jgi:hypothetical protein
MSIAGMAVGGIVAIVFIADLLISIPFGGKGGPLVHIGLAICGLTLAYLGWNAMREVK